MDKKNIDKFNKLKLKYFKILSDLGIKNMKLNLELTASRLNYDDIDGLKSFIWTKFNSIVKENINDNYKLQNIYFEMEQFLKTEQKEKDATYIRELFFQAKLKAGKESLNGIIMDVVLIAKNKPNVCEVCKKDNGKKYSIDKALKSHILPHKKCKCDNGCICTLGFVAKRDNQGKLIFVD
ncbi:hypothetical protein [Chryseobacterium arthrosphaerae]|uniref:hypothetical protein n=1 Tax=Chryseobacterium arthrosphaerae TaxID=651561 RepID=UPI0031DD5290